MSKTRMNAFVTVKDITAATGVSRNTLIRWAALGLILSPRVVPVGSGRGMQGRWAPSVLDRVKRIRGLVAEGHRLSAVAALLQTEEAERQSQRSRR